MKIKSLIVTTSLLLGVVGINSAMSQVQEDTVNVKGVCGECKARIENAAYGKGVKFVEWNKDTKVLKVAYNIKKTDLLTIEQRIAKAGHQTTHVPAQLDDYNALPACCQYEHHHDH